MILNKKSGSRSSPQALFKTSRWDEVKERQIRSKQSKIYLSTDFNFRKLFYWVNNFVAIIGLRLHTAMLRQKKLKPFLVLEKKFMAEETQPACSFFTFIILIRGWHQENSLQFNIAIKKYIEFIGYINVKCDPKRLSFLTSPRNQRYSIYFTYFLFLGILYYLADNKLLTFEYNRSNVCINI